MLRQLGVAPGDKCMLMCENRPEWGITYFAFLLAGAAVGAARLAADAAPRCRTSRARRRAKVIVLSRKVAERLASEANIALPIPDDDDEPDVMQVWSVAHPALQEYLANQGLDVRVMAFDELLTEPDVSVGAVRPEVKGDTLASLIFTCGHDRHAEGRDAVAQQFHVDGEQAVGAVHTRQARQAALGAAAAPHVRVLRRLPDAARARRAD